ncbi:DUF2207 domain-containing protein [Alkalicoccus halolimnae]|uniref:DUF2207 domain-containing protein n=1 Tax=Alkalicoccus halolimnae TaxID=1667239 RepID=A0A5C7F2U1_9BACI|nr:DUF2207 domain-containing protein [Alkalicoccus halolimnae]TXF84672.1 DUF2207 domain-containing protein [Alkalicoccus halolimnae]
MKWFISAWSMIIVCFFLPFSAGAFELTIPEAEIHAHLQEDGSVEVEETFTYAFEGEFNGVVRTLNHPEETAVENLQAYENGEELVIETEEEIVHSIHRSGEDETFTVDLHYTIENGVERFTDVGQFYWAFFDSSNEMDYEAMSIFIYPPEESENVQAIGYDEAEGAETITEDGIVIFDLGHVESGSNGDIRTAFDEAMFSGAERTSNDTAGRQIAVEKEEREEQAAAFAERRNFLDSAAPFLLFAAVAAIVFLIFRDNLKFRYGRSRADNAEREKPVPEPIMSMPATMMYIHQTVTPEMLSASLLDLVRKGKAMQEGEDGFRIKERDELLSHEIKLIEMLDDMSEENVFHLKDMASYLEKKENYETFKKKEAEWTKEVKKEQKEEKLVIERKTFRFVLMLAATLTFAAGIVFMIHGLILPFVILGLTAVTFLLYPIVYQPKTDKGSAVSGEWQDFRKRLKEYTVEDWQRLTPSEQKTAFIFGLGLNLKSVKKIAGELTKQIPADRKPLDYADSSTAFMMTGVLVSTQFHSTTAQASTSFSSGPGVGGGTGAGGGGGGSGGF